MNSLLDLFCRVSASFLRHLNASRRPIRLKKNGKGPKQTQLEVVPPRKGWSLSATESQRNPVKVQSTALYAKNMGARIAPITRVTERNSIRTVLQKKALQGRMRSTLHATNVHHASRIQAMQSCLRRSQSLKNLIRNSSAQTKRASMVTTVTETTPTHLGMMGLVALGN